MAALQMLGQIESELTTVPYFAGERFTTVDAVFGPLFRYFDVFEQFEDFGFFARTPVRASRAALFARAFSPGRCQPGLSSIAPCFLAGTQKCAVQPHPAAPGRMTRPNWRPSGEREPTRFSATRAESWPTA